MMKRSMIAAMALVAAAAAPAHAQEEKASLALPILSVTFTPAYVAKDKGFWAKEGLDVSLHDISGLGATNAMLAGSIDFAVQSGLSFIRGNMRGQKMLAIALMANGVAFEITGRKELLGGITMATPIAERAKWLKGRKVAVDAPNTIVHAFLRYIAKKGGVDAEKEITVTPMQPETELAAMKSGAIDAGTWTFPWTYASQRQGDVLIASGLSDVPELLPFGSTDTATRPDFCQKKESVCRKLGRGYAQAHAFIHDHPAEAFEVVRKRLPQIDAGDLKAAFDAMVKTTPKVPTFSEEGLAHAQELMLIGGMIKPDEKMSSFTALYTNKYVQ
jgi:ABC-type nitrate/sulfonate/bicarbonate transport system substrate-binding protein